MLMNKFTAFEDAAMLNMHGLSNTVHGVGEGGERGRERRDKDGRVGGEGGEGKQGKWSAEQEILAHLVSTFLSSCLSSLALPPGSPLSSNGTSFLVVHGHEDSKHPHGSTLRKLMK